MAPWHLENVGHGKAYVVTTATGKKHSKEPLPIKKALAQLAALHANVKE